MNKETEKKIPEKVELMVAHINASGLPPEMLKLSYALIDQMKIVANKSKRYKCVEKGKGTIFSLMDAFEE